MSSETTDSTPYILTAKYTNYVDVRKEFESEDEALRQAKKMPRSMRAGDPIADFFDLPTPLSLRRYERVSVRVVHGVREWLSYATLESDGRWQTGQGVPPVESDLVKLRTDDGVAGDRHVVYVITERPGTVRRVRIATVEIPADEVSGFTATVTSDGYRDPASGEVVPVARLTTSHNAQTGTTSIELYADKQDAPARREWRRESFTSRDDADALVLKTIEGTSADQVAPPRDSRVVALCHAIERTDVVYANPKRGSSLSW